MKNLFISSVLLIGLTTLNSCKKKETVWLYRYETQCSDPWGGGYESENKKKRNIEKYLKEKGIKAFEVEIIDENAGGFNCHACSCGTGNKIQIKVSKEDVSKAKEEKFYE